MTDRPNANGADDRAEAFRLAISGSLRLDPDILMVGEIRDARSSAVIAQCSREVRDALSHTALSLESFAVLLDHHLNPLIDPQ